MSSSSCDFIFKCCQDLKNNPGFKITYTFTKQNSLLVTDVWRLIHESLISTRPYEKVKGSANELYQSWVENTQRKC